MRALRDERGVIVSWIAKLVAGLAVGSVVLFDAGAIAVNYVGLDSTAEDIANALSADVAGAGAPVSSAQLEASAAEAARAAGARVVRVEIDPQGFLHLRLKRAAKTLLASNIDSLRKWTRATATATAATS
jgi:hypothetical protein